MGLGGSNAGDQAAGLAQQQQTQLDSALGQIQGAFSSFTPDFYNKVGQDYTNFALPQVTQQYQQQQKQLQGNLAGQGILDSSGGANLSNQLSQNLAQAQNQVADSALNQAQTFQQGVQQQENTLVNQAEAASDPLSIAQGALAQASSIKAPSLFAPVGNFFSNWANQYGAQQSVNAANQTNTLLNNAISSGFIGSSNFAPLGGSGVIP